MGNYCNFVLPGAVELRVVWDDDMINNNKKCNQHLEGPHRETSLTKPCVPHLASIVDWIQCESGDVGFPSEHDLCGERFESEDETDGKKGDEESQVHFDERKLLVDSVHV